MRPELVLGMKSYSDPAKLRDEWLKEYAKYENDPSDGELTGVLKARMLKAYDLVMAGKLEEDPSLDGDFPLGKPEDAEFMVPMFRIDQLVLLQLGAPHLVQAGHYVEPAYDVLVRKGILHELSGDYANAYVCYNAVPSPSANNRGYACKKVALAKYNTLMEQAHKHLSQGDWKAAWYPLMEAKEIEYVAPSREAAAMLGHQYAYGLGVPKDTEEGLQLLRKAAADYLHPSYDACMTLVDLHDGGLWDVEGEEALALCTKAAEAGVEKAKMRLAEGFDTRSNEEICREQIEKGSIDAPYSLACYLRRKGDGEFLYWLEKAAGKGIVAAMVELAEIYMKTDRQTEGEGIYRKAAELGSVEAIKALARRDRNKEDPLFFLAAMHQAEAPSDAALTERHKKEMGWALLAAEAGDPFSMYQVAMAYHYGYPCERDDIQAFTWAARGAEEGRSECHNLLGILYENGHGCARNIHKAIAHYDVAAQKGILMAIARLAEIYRDGADGVEPDKEKATRYLFMGGFGRD